MTPLILILIAAVAFPGISRARAQEAANLAQGRDINHSRRVSTKDDLAAIGTRRIGGHGIGNWYSLESEMKMGRESSKDVEQTAKLDRDPLVTEYINRIGQSLVRNSDANVPFTIKVIDSDEVDAFALPGGFLYINTGLILATQDEAELAAVMAHEIAHVAAHHATREITRSHMLSLASIPLLFVGGPAGMALQDALKIAGPLSLNKFSRGFEAEADYLGVEYLYKAGYDPQALISFFERIRALEKQKQGLMSKAFASHPQTAGRISKTRREISTILPPRDMYLVSTSEFDEVKARLSATGSHQAREAARPSLRRRPNSDGAKPFM
jgi:beta-barrel assembly-enhancing protease